MEAKQQRLLDTQFAKFLSTHSQLSGEENLMFKELVCKLSVTVAAGDSCLPVKPEEENLLQRSGLCGEGVQPLCVFDGHLYLQRLFQYERRLAENIRKMAVEATELVSDVSLVESLFVTRQEEQLDLQRFAAEQALRKNFLIIAGGPGTGKTTTVVKILTLLNSGFEKPLRVALAAPTGKAAVRLQESIAGHGQHLSARASTIHRLLGVRRNSPYFRHNAENPIPYDVLVVDEASMVDLALMSKLFDALRPGSRLILLGDKNQLASVESGTVLADMMQALPENTVELQKSYRFDEGIKCFAESINTGDHKKAWQMLTSSQPHHITLLQEDLAIYAGAQYSRYMAAVSEATTLDEYKNLFSLFYSFKILCALRRGKAGVAGINKVVEESLTDKGYDCKSEEWYPGRPVMVTKNEYALDLYNGDIGICLPGPDSSGGMKIWFECPDGTLRGILPGRISSCETVYALTIHKSQGAEFAEVLVVLPENESTLITRELLYTAVTRAKKYVIVKSGRSVFQRAVKERISRFSGLGKMLNEEKELNIEHRTFNIERRILKT